MFAQTPINMLLMSNGASATESIRCSAARDAHIGRESGCYGLDVADSIGDAWRAARIAGLALKKETPAGVAGCGRPQGTPPTAAPCVALPFSILSPKSFNGGRRHFGGGARAVFVRRRIVVRSVFADSLATLLESYR